jgi:hypothetical protein
MAGKGRLTVVTYFVDPTSGISSGPGTHQSVRHYISLDVRVCGEGKRVCEEGRGMYGL